MFAIYSNALVDERACQIKNEKLRMKNFECLLVDGEWSLEAGC